MRGRITSNLLGRGSSIGEVQRVDGVHTPDRAFSPLYATVLGLTNPKAGESHHLRVSYAANGEEQTAAKVME